MNSEKLNSWLGVFANIGVVVGIVFLALEVNQNSSELEQNRAVSTAQATAQRNGAMDDDYRALAQDPELAQLVKSGYDNPDSLTELQRVQFGWWLRKTFNNHEATWFYYSRGLIPEEDYGGYRTALCNRVNTNGGRWYWEGNAEYFASGFVSYIDDWCFNNN
jgi:hypothetical protein